MDVDLQGFRPLHHAMMAGQYDMAKYLLTAGADPTAHSYVNSIRQTPVGCLGFHGMYGSLSTWQDLVRLFEDYIEYGDQNVQKYPSDGLEWTLHYLLHLGEKSCDPRLRDEFVQWVLRRHRQSILDSCHEPLIGLLVSMALLLGNVLILKTVLAMQPRGVTLSFRHHQTLFRQLLIGPHTQTGHMSWIRIPSPKFKEALQLIHRYAQDSHLTRSEETAMCHGFWFSRWFQMWRKWSSEELDMFLALGLNCSQSLLTRHKWQLHSLRLLFELPEFNTIDQNHQHSPGYCSSSCCRWGLLSYEPDFYDIISFIEPWWESIKEDIKATECLCLVRDRFREFEPISHRGECTASSEHTVTCQARCLESSAHTELLHIEDDLENSLNQAPSATLSKTSGDVLTDEIARQSSIRDLLLNRYWEQGGVWRNSYRPGEILCFKCLAQREQWIPNASRTSHDMSGIDVDAQGTAADMQRIPGKFPGDQGRRGQS
ncbi:hypothetical protein EV356DRAFT_7278 [Viridothelium virens]|uniref:Uncharacterized protein n=1 Tax=Viridothelium virens TaxID=1048519 RepID=A0A6A6HQ47_VIRVR|nr:hypothetical protein EV356DRAFT_7278 [Viridothelium virens]